MARRSQPCVQLLLEAKRTLAGVKPFGRVAATFGLRARAALWMPILAPLEIYPRDSFEPNSSNV